MSEHTPGPWSVGCVAYTLNQTGWESTVIVPGDNGTVYPARAYGLTPEQSKANAGLIAAAPELLALAHEVASVALGRRHDGSQADEDLEGLLLSARAVIAKAEGR